MVLCCRTRSQAWSFFCWCLRPLLFTSHTTCFTGKWRTSSSEWRRNPSPKETWRYLSSFCICPVWMVHTGIKEDNEAECVHKHLKGFDERSWGEGAQWWEDDLHLNLSRQLTDSYLQSLCCPPPSHVSQEKRAFRCGICWGKSQAKCEDLKTVNKRLTSMKMWLH